jgi:hypothetical protein
MKEKGGKRKKGGRGKGEEGRRKDTQCIVYSVQCMKDVKHAN